MQEIQIHVSKWDSHAKTNVLGAQTIKAHVFGNWAAHKALGKGYAVTHIPTGIRGGTWSKLSDAKRQAEFMEQGESIYPYAEFVFGKQPDPHWVKAVAHQFRAFKDSMECAAP